MSLEQSLCEAIDILVDRAISQANFDKTISATIVECADESSGKYKVKYQDSTYYATTDNTSIKYSKNAEVYVLVPEGDFSKPKKILGTVKSIGIEYPEAVEDVYETIGNNIITTFEPLSLCSYKTELKTIYDINDLEHSVIEVNQEAAKEYLSISDYLIASAEFKTIIPRENRNYGNFGIIFGLDFFDAATQSLITKDYIIDVDNMLGQPYNLVQYTKQKEQFDFNGSNFIQIQYVKIFVNNFIQQDDTKEDDIFVRAIEFGGSLKQDSSALPNYSLSILTPQGTFFSADGKEDEIKLQAQLKIKGMSVNSTDHSVDYYWFVEQSDIDSSSVGYHKYGGQGWKCLNPYIVISQDENGVPIQVEYAASADGIYKVQKENCFTFETRFKCVAIYSDNITVSQEIIIKNYNADFEISIISSNGVEFFYSQGVTNLACEIDNSENLSYNYYWSKKNSVGTYEKLEETVEENQRYKQAQNLVKFILDSYKNDLAYEEKIYEFGINSEFSLIEAYILSLDKESYTYDELKLEVEAYLNNKNIYRLEGNMIYNIQVKTISNFNNFSCAVYLDGECIGNASIKLTNSFDGDPGVSLTIINGNQVYKYSESGLSPAYKYLDDPIVIKSLFFEIYDNKGNKVDKEIIKYFPIKWKIPIENSFLISNMEYVQGVAEEGYLVFKDVLSFNYNIINNYDINAVNNNIILEVDYYGNPLKAETSFFFLKEGDSGTNGTDMVCRIIPNTLDSFSSYPQLTIFEDSAEMNYNIDGNGFDAIENKNWFRVQLWKSDTNVFDGIESKDNYNVKWSILKNKYNSLNFDVSCVSVTENGIFNKVGSELANSANIIKVTVTYNGKQYFATMPLNILVLKSNEYSINFKDNSGFNSVIYSSDGLEPKYSTTNPFEIEVFKENENITPLLTYEWDVQGNIYDYNIESASKEWMEIDFLKETKSHKTYIKSYEPIEPYNGQCVNIGLKIDVKIGDELIGSLHRPIHFLLNRFGNAAINDWDGNSISLDEEGGMILAPQVGAGFKDSNNRFTGVVMGSVDDQSSEKKEHGLVGYYQGQRSIFLDAETGKAEFGIQDASRIILDPSNDRAEIRSGNYSAENKTGMLIDLTTPEIKYGSENFQVDKDGHLTAKGGGSIAGWNIADQSLTKDTVGISSDNSKGTNIAFWAGNSNAAEAPFRVNYDGKLYASGAYIEGSINVTNGGKIGGWEIRYDPTNSLDEIAGTASDGKRTVMQNPGAGTYVFAAGGTSTTNYNDYPFRVTKDGVLYSVGGVFDKAEISNATINKAKISNLGVGDLNLSDITFKGQKITPVKKQIVTNVDATKTALTKLLNLEYMDINGKDCYVITEWPSESVVTLVQHTFTQTDLLTAT